MCGSMVDIQSLTTEIWEGKKERKIETTGQNYNVRIYYASAMQGGHDKLPCKTQPLKTVVEKIPVQWC